MNRFSLYRQIRYQRTYRTIGKMSWWRIVLGIVLMASVFLISGVVSQYFASHEQFRTAQFLMISPQWMENNKPETKAFIEAGVLFEDGSYAAAAEAFGQIDEVDAAKQMMSRSYVKLASEVLGKADYEGAYDALTQADIEQLSEEDTQEYVSLCEALQKHFQGSDGDGRLRASELRAMLQAASAE